MKRRRFLERSAAAGLWLTYGGCAPSEAREDDTRYAAAGAGRSGRESPSWGLQLYTLRSLMAEDVERTLAQVGAIGYREVEFAGYFGRSPEQIRATLDAEGLTAPAVHLSIADFRQRLDAVLAAAGVIGHRYLVLPSLDQADRSDIDGYRRIAEEMNGFAERCRAEGVRFAYHNHDFELVSMDGTVPLDVLIEGTDPDLVDFEMDLFWMVNGGADPLDYFERYPGRFHLCHVKDRTRGGDMVSVGEGAIDFAGIFARSEQAGLIHYFVEHDNPAEPLESVRASLDHLTALEMPS